MSSANFVYVGAKGTAIALQRDSGAIVWETHLKGSDFVHLVLDHDSLYATTYGEIFCLDPVTGAIRWENPLRGYGLGITSIAVRNERAAIDLNLTAEELGRSHGASQDTIFIS